MGVRGVYTWSSPVVIWLLTGCLLVFAMVAVGGITRLTGSGLSITEWNVIMGAIPPMTETDWQVAFEKYQDSPQFQQQNFHFSLPDFKKIFWWEYIHRLIGRLTGIVFIIPFCWFLLQKQLDGKLLLRLLFIFALGGFQGFIGWYMVSSGLVDNPRVSHYRLATHLLTAFTTFGFIFWTTLGLLYPVKKENGLSKAGIYRVSLFLFALVLLQITFGAFVAGLKAGMVYNTFPKMGDEWMAASVGMAWENDGWKSLVENLASIQFVHRSLAWMLVLVYGLLLILCRREKKISVEEMKSLRLTGWALLLQFVLGVFTLLYQVPMWLGVLHQSVAFMLFASVLALLHRMKYTGRLLGRESV